MTFSQIGAPRPSRYNQPGDSIRHSPGTLAQCREESGWRSRGAWKHPIADVQGYCTRRNAGERGDGCGTSGRNGSMKGGRSEIMRQRSASMRQGKSGQMSGRAKRRAGGCGELGVGDVGIAKCLLQWRFSHEELSSQRRATGRAGVATGGSGTQFGGWRWDARDACPHLQSFRSTRRHGLRALRRRRPKRYFRAEGYC